MKTTLVVPDLQVPYHSKTLLKKMFEAASWLEVDRVLIIGDLIDMPQVSRWNKGSAGEYVSTLQTHIDTVKREVFEPLAGLGVGVDWLLGNHDIRLYEYVKKYAYPLLSLRSLRLSALFDTDAHGVRIVDGPVQVAPNTIAIHGHEPGGYAASPAAWDLKFLKRYGTQNVVFGHTHQPYLLTSATGHSGAVSPRWTMNVGSLMDPKHASYVGDGAVNWTPSFGLIRSSGKSVWPSLVLANGSKFMVDGEIF